MPQKTQKNVTSGGGSRGRSRSRSGSKSRSRSRSGSRNGLRPLTLALPLNSTKARPSVTYNNFFRQQYSHSASDVRSPGGTRLAEYRKVGPPTPGYLPRYPSSGSSRGSSRSSNSNLSMPNSEEMLAAGAGHAARFNRVYPAIRPRSANRPEYNVHAYRRGQNPLGRRESF